MLSATAAARLFGLSRSELRAASAFARWNAEAHIQYTGRFVRSDGYVAVRVGADFQLEHRVLMERHLGRSSEPANTSTTETALNTTIDLRTLKSQCRRSRQRASSWPTGRDNGRLRMPLLRKEFSPPACSRLRTTLELSALAHAISRKRKPPWTRALTSPQPICLARKPLSKPNVAANVLRWGTVRASNVDGCRVGDSVETWSNLAPWRLGQMQPGGKGRTVSTGAVPPGRWPANLCLSWPEDEYALRRDMSKRTAAKNCQVVP